MAIILCGIFFLFCVYAIAQSDLLVLLYTVYLISNDNIFLNSHILTLQYILFKFSREECWTNIFFIVEISRKI